MQYACVPTADEVRTFGIQQLVRHLGRGAVRLAAFDDVLQIPLYFGGAGNVLPPFSPGGHAVLHVLVIRQSVDVVLPSPQLFDAREPAPSGKYAVCGLIIRACRSTGCSL